MPENKQKIVEQQRTYEKVTSTQRIITFMHLLEGNSKALQGSFAGHAGSDKTTLLEVDKNQNYILLGQFTEKKAEFLLQKYKVLQLSSIVKGAEYSFQVRLIKVKGAKKNVHYKMSIPKSVFYSQRRESRRVHISLALAITASFDKDSGQMIVGQLRDISSGGMRVQFTKTNPQKFAVTSSVAPCIINLSTTSDVQCDFEVRYMRPHEQDRGCTIGVSFHELDSAKKSVIEKFMTTVERKSLREYRS